MPLVAFSSFNRSCHHELLCNFLCTSSRLPLQHLPRWASGNVSAWISSSSGTSAPYCFLDQPNPGISSEARPGFFFVRHFFLPDEGAGESFRLGSTSASSKGNSFEGYDLSSTVPESAGGSSIWRLLLRLFPGANCLFQEPLLQPGAEGSHYHQSGGGFDLKRFQPSRSLLNLKNFS